MYPWPRLEQSTLKDIPNMFLFFVSLSMDLNLKIHFSHGHTLVCIYFIWCVSMVKNSQLCSYLCVDEYENLCSKQTTVRLTSEHHSMINNNKVIMSIIMTTDISWVPVFGLAISQTYRYFINFSSIFQRCIFKGRHKIYIHISMVPIFWNIFGFWQIFAVFFPIDLQYNMVYIACSSL